MTHQASTRSNKCTLFGADGLILDLAKPRFEGIVAQSGKSTNISPFRVLLLLGHGIYDGSQSGDDAGATETSDNRENWRKARTLI